LKQGIRIEKKIAREYNRRSEKHTASKEPKTFREPKKKEIKTWNSKISSKCQLSIIIKKPITGQFYQILTFVRVSNLIIYIDKKFLVL